MIIEREQDGLYFQLESTDWRGYWQELFAWVKSHQVNIEWQFDKLDNRWWICEELVEDFSKVKKKYIDEVVNPGQGDLGF